MSHIRLWFAYEMVKFSGGGGGVGALISSRVASRTGYVALP